MTFLGSLLALPDELMSAPMLQPYPHQYNTVSCPDLKVIYGREIKTWCLGKYLRRLECKRNRTAHAQVHFEPPKVIFDKSRREVGYFVRIRELITNIRKIVSLPHLFLAPLPYVNYTKKCDTDFLIMLYILATATQIFVMILYLYLSTSIVSTAAELLKFFFSM